MAEDLKDIERKLAGHRRSIDEHKRKYRQYPARQDKEFALKTIKRIQEEIKWLKKKNPRASNGPQDSWVPGWGD
jgi:NADH:ubiquinone oxidoreductase subunit E